MGSFKAFIESAKTLAMALDNDYSKSVNEMMIQLFDQIKNESNNTDILYKEFVDLFGHVMRLRREHIPFLTSYLNRRGSSEEKKRFAKVCAGLYYLDQAVESCNLSDGLKNSIKSFVSTKRTKVRPTMSHAKMTKHQMIFIMVASSLFTGGVAMFYWIYYFAVSNLQANKSIFQPHSQGLFDHYAPRHSEAVKSACPASSTALAS